MKKLLVIQKDSASFLHETIQVIEKNQSFFKGHELTLLVDANALNEVSAGIASFLTGITTVDSEAMSSNYDVSVNVSLDEPSWVLHGQIRSLKKLGPYYEGHSLRVEDLWSSFLLTLKSQAPFLTFHLQDIYKNIFGIKATGPGRQRPRAAITQVAYGMTGSHVFPTSEQESFIDALSKSLCSLPIKDVTEYDLIEDHSSTLYVGPPTVAALRLCAAGAQAIFLTSAFRGLHLLPYQSNYLLVSSGEDTFSANELINIVRAYCEKRDLGKTSYALYVPNSDHFPGACLEALGRSDDSFPFYQAHVVLWNFLLNLTEVDLKVSTCIERQKKFLQSYQQVLLKFIRLHDYAMVAMDDLQRESRLPHPDQQKLTISLKHLTEIEQIGDQLAKSHPYLCQIIDFYRIRRGQPGGYTLREQAQSSFLTYAEEHQTLMAFQELISVTLERNEVSI